MPFLMQLLLEGGWDWLQPPTTLLWDKLLDDGWMVDRSLQQLLRQLFCFEPNQMGVQALCYHTSDLRPTCEEEKTNEENDR